MALQSLHRHSAWLVPLGLSLLAGIASFQAIFQTPDRLFYDAYLRWQSRSPPTDIVIIEIDDQSLQAFGRWPFSRSHHAALIDRLTTAGAHVIGLDILFVEADTAASEADQSLVAAIAAHGSVVLPVAIEPLRPGGQLIEILPFPALTASAAGLGHVHVELDPDGIARTAYLYEGLSEAHWPGFALEMLRLAGIHPELPRASAAAQGSSQPSLSIIVRSHPVLIPYGGSPGRFAAYSYADVLANRIPGEAFRDKIVLVGATSTGLGDVLPTPVSGTNRPMPGVEIQATLVEGLRAELWLQDLTPLGNALLTCVLVITPLLLFPYVLPQRTLLLVVAGVALVCAIGLSLAILLRWWFPPASAITTLLTAYPIWSLGRLAFTVRFLRRSLDALSQEPVLANPSQDLDQVQATLAFWRRLLPLSGYCVATPGGQELVRWGKAPPYPAAVILHGHWRHLADSSWIRLKLGSQHLRIGLAWRDPHGIAYAAPLLERLGELPVPSSARSAHEWIEARAQQVEDATERLRRMHRFIGDTLTHMSDGVLVGDALGRCLIVNERMQGLLGTPPRHTKDALSVLEVLQPEDGASWREALATTLISRQPSTLAAKAAGKRQLLVHIAALNLGVPLGPGFVVNAADVTMLKEAEQRRSETLHFLSHDLRSPMVSLLATIEQAKHDPQHTPLPDLLRRLEAYAARNLALAEQFLQLARVESDTPFECYEFDLLEAAQNAADQVSVQAFGKSQHLVLEDGDESDTWYYGNAELLERVFVNLLNNAIKYSPRDTCIRFTLQRSPEGWYCRVQDQGIGIPEEAISGLFDRFTRIYNAVSHSQSGAGLGLRFVKTVIDRHGGTIRVDSQLGQGSTFEIFLPDQAALQESDNN